MAIYKLGDKTPNVAASAYVFESSTVIGDVHLAENTSIWPYASLRADNAPIYIGKGSNIQEGSILHTDPGCPLKIAENVTVGHQAMLHGCEIGEGSLIGIQAVVLNRVKIGKNCLIGAGALIPEGREIPDNSLVLGSPGKVVRTLSPEEITGLELSAKHYSERAAEFKTTLKRID